MAVAATGFFDGVHRGHRHLLDILVSSARKRAERAIVVTFSKHPRTVLQQDARTLRLLTSTEEKIALLKACGVDSVEVLGFDRSFSSMTARQYLSEVLRDTLGVTAVVVGYDTRMGSDRLGPDAIAETASQLGLEVIVCGPEGDISSTRIRKALEQGLVEDAADMLGYRYMLNGVVVAGNRMGRTIGFPTANMKLYEPLKLVPLNGVYKVEVEVLGRRFSGMTNIGYRPTLGLGNERTIETSIFDFDEDIYGLDIELRFVSRVRDEMKFDSMKELAAQLEKDRAVCCCQ